MSEIAQAVDRALLTIIAAAEEGPRSIREISEMLGISTTAARRVVITLHREAMLRKREDGRYDVGPRLIRITEHLLGRFAMRAHPFMDALAMLSSRSVILTSFRADDASVLHQADPDRLKLRIDYRTDYSRALVDGADGLVILANLDEARRGRLVREAGIPGLEERLDRIRTAGHLLQRTAVWGELPGLSAPIMHGTIGITGALTLLGNDLDDDLEAWVSATIDAAQAIGQELTVLTRSPLDENGAEQ